MYEEYDTIEKQRFLKAKLLTDPLFFTRFFFKYYQGRKFIVGEHHKLISEKIKKIYSGEIKKLIINIAPRYSKTEIVVKTVIAQGLALNPRAKFIHVSYSDTLALDNSEQARDLVQSDYYQHFFPLQIKHDSKSKKKWYTAEGGGVYSTASGGQITGFGAGIVEDDDEDKKTVDEFFSDMEMMQEFGGAFIIDDPIKPDDARSLVTRDGINEKFDTTFRSRVNSRNTPFILIMQRVHADDLTGYLLKKEPGEWDTLILPALKDDGEPLWPFKHTKEELYKLSKINPYVFYYQYQQQDIDIPTGGAFLENFDPARHIKKIEIKKDCLINISIDSNRFPYISITFIQAVADLKGKYDIRIIHHIPAREPNNSAGKAGKLASEWLQAIGYELKNVRMYGDKTTKSGNTIDEENRSFAELFANALRRDGFTVEDKMLNFSPTVAPIGEFVNAILTGEMPFAEISMNETCIEAKKDYLEAKKDKDGGIMKRSIRDPRTKISYQPEGHCVDNLKDYIVAAFYNDFVNYKRIGKKSHSAGRSFLGSKNSY